MDITGNGPGGKDEGSKINTLKNPSEFEMDDIRTDVWDLLDPGTVNAAYFGRGKNNVKSNRGDSKQIDVDIPGVDLARDPCKRVGDIIFTHLTTIQNFFPEAFDRGILNSRNNVKAFLRDKTNVPNEKIDEINNGLFE